MIRLKVNKDILNKYKNKYGNNRAITGYGEEVKALPFLIPRHFVVVLNKEALTIVELDKKFNEKSVGSIPVSTIQTVKIIGPVVKSVIVKTTDRTIKFVIKPTIMGISKEQSALLTYLRTHFKHAK
ncbi:hypothetical protein [Marinilactibacillus sp. Marseille-P9653]|uniref:hypothetical protein n=1 Tax=Marinilactibacillus sp. Marseille-P9653 TaxID=2866583 RepID=UPI001CE4A7B0|nr:hypothetical protein [Marinilactibacillus sp. Marseille-P9653]